MLHFLSGSILSLGWTNSCRSFSKLTRLTTLTELQYVLILRSFQEKCIPEHCFHVCHIMEEKVSPCRPGSGLVGLVALSRC
uniref:Uncharacterized protein n=1 Tax=Amphiprion percula TaxID=161767 RepID=A0A3P8SAD2_AMPPE